MRDIASDVLKTLASIDGLEITEAGVKDAIDANPGKDPWKAAKDIKVFAHGGLKTSNGASLLNTFLGNQQFGQAENPTPTVELVPCRGCRESFTRNQLRQQRCHPCYDRWEEAVMINHERTTALYYGRFVRQVDKAAA